MKLFVFFRFLEKHGFRPVRKACFFVFRRGFRRPATRLAER